MTKICENLVFAVLIELHKTFCYPFFYKVITTMVIKLLDDSTRCAQSVVAHLRPLRLGVHGDQG